MGHNMRKNGVIEMSTIKTTEAKMKIWVTYTGVALCIENMITLSYAYIYDLLLNSP